MFRNEAFYLNWRLRIWGTSETDHLQRRQRVEKVSNTRSSDLKWLMTRGGAGRCSELSVQWEAFWALERVNKVEREALRSNTLRLNILAAVGGLEQ